MLKITVASAALVLFATFSPASAATGTSLPDWRQAANEQTHDNFNQCVERCRNRGGRNCENRCARR